MDNTNGTTTTTVYVNGFVYVNDVLQFMAQKEGRIRVNSNSTGFIFDYYLKDHLGNIRMTLTDDNTAAAPVLDAKSYYPFGLVQTNISLQASGSLINKYQFGGKEIQNKEFSDGSGLEEYDFGARFLDPQLGVWHNIDLLAEKTINYSPYTYCFDNPIGYIDLLGMEGNDANGGDGNQMVHVMYTMNPSTGEIFTEEVSDEVYEGNTNGGTTNVVQLEYNYKSVSGPNGSFSTPHYHGSNYYDGGSENGTNQNYSLIGAHFKSGTSEQNEVGKILDKASKINDYGIGAIGAFGTGKMTPEFIWSTAFDAQFEGKILSNRTVNLIEDAAALTKYGKLAGYAGPLIQGGIGVIKTLSAFKKEGH